MCIRDSVGALSDCVLDGETGLLVPPRDPKSLGAAIVRLIKNPTLAQKFGNAGREWVVDECSPESVARQHLEVYKKAIVYRAEQLAPSETPENNSQPTKRQTTC